MALSLKKRRDMMKAAKKLFLAQGFQGTSMDAVIEVAKVSKKTLYQHFPSKMELFHAMLLEHWTRVTEEASTILKHDEKPAVALKNYSLKFLKFLYQSETQQLFRLLIAESERFPHLSTLLTVERKAPFTRELIRYLEAQTKGGRLKIKDTSLAASHLMGLLKEEEFWPTLLGFSNKLNTHKINKIVDYAVDVFLNYYAK